MLQAIQVRYLAATNTQPARLKALCRGFSRTVCIGRYASMDDETRAIAHELQVSLDWPGEYIGGALPNGDWCFVREGN